MNNNIHSDNSTLVLESDSISADIKSIRDKIEEHNLAFNGANSIFSQVESGLNNIAFDYWYPPHLFPIIYHNPQLNSFAPPIQTYQPFFITSYLLGFAPYGETRRLVIKKVTSEYDFVRYPDGSVFLGANFCPHTYKVKDTVEDPVPVADSSREVRIMVIQNLHPFFEAIQSSIGFDTERLRVAVESSSRI